MLLDGTCSRSANIDCARLWSRRINALKRSFGTSGAAFEAM